MQAGKAGDTSADQLLKFLESKAGVWVVFIITGVGWAVWFLTVLVLSPGGHHFPVWFWICLPFLAAITIAFSGLMLMLVCVALLSIWIHTEGRSIFIRAGAAILAAVIVALMLGFQYVNQY